jgi:triosephosphate isomerase
MSTYDDERPPELTDTIERSELMTVLRRPLIAGNWKMNGLITGGTALAGDLGARLRGAGPVPFDMLVCPPFTLISAVGAAIAGSGLLLGAQDCAAAASGAHTGDISAPMLADAGCGFILVGHSERRADHGEADATVRAKAAAAHGAGVGAVICIGETEAERDATQAEAVVRRQLAGSLPGGATAANTVIAYEPVWAIGTGRTPTADDVQAIHALIRAETAKIMGVDAAAAIRLLYGGSVKPENAVELLSLPDVDGGLIGGASLKADDFWLIAERST